MRVFNVCDIGIPWKRYKKDVNRGEGSMKKFCESIRELAVNAITFEKKKIIPLTNEQQESHEKTHLHLLYLKNTWLSQW